MARYVIYQIPFYAKEQKLKRYKSKKKAKRRLKKLQGGIDLYTTFEIRKES